MLNLEYPDDNGIDNEAKSIDTDLNDSKKTLVQEESKEQEYI